MSAIFEFSFVSHPKTKTKKHKKHKKIKKRKKKKKIKKSYPTNL